MGAAMPITIERICAPGRSEVLRVVMTGEVTVDDASKHITKITNGGQHYGVPCVCTIAADATFSAEARRLLGALTGTDASLPLGLVVTSAPTRVLMNFWLRVTPTRPNYKTFTDEGPALEWIEAEMKQRAQALDAKP